MHEDIDLSSVLCFDCSEFGSHLHAGGGTSWKRVEFAQRLIVYVLLQQVLPSTAPCLSQISIDYAQ